MHTKPEQQRLQEFQPQNFQHAYALNRTEVEIGNRVKRFPKFCRNLQIRCGKFRQPMHVKDLQTKCKKDPKSWRSHQDTNMIFLNVCPESDDLWWKFPKDRLCYFLYEHCEMSAKLHLLRMWVYVFSCMMVLWKVLLRQWRLWGPAAAIRWRNHRRFVAADHWRRAEGGRGGLIMPKRGLIPTICLLSTV